MADLWTQEFCLGCDKQTDGSAYCSQSCRLADFEKTSMPGSVASSPGLDAPSGPWTTTTTDTATTTTQGPSGLYLAPAIDFSNPRPFASTPSQFSFSGQRTTHSLTPSSSNSSLSSLSTVSSTTETGQLCQKTKQELQGYAAFFDNARLARRRSY